MQTPLMRNTSIQTEESMKLSRGLSSVIVLVVVVITAMISRADCKLHKDCDQHKVIMNFKRMCHNYPHIKRSTLNYNIGRGGVNNEVIPWSYGYGYASGPSTFFYPPPPPPVQQQAPQPPQLPYNWNWEYWQTPISYPTEDTSFNDDAMEDFFNPLYFEGEEVQATLERWRRDEKLKMELEHFMISICCVKGCPFPKAYTDFDGRTNICKMR